MEEVSLGPMWQEHEVEPEMAQYVGDELLDILGAVCIGNERDLDT